MTAYARDIEDTYQKADGTTFLRQWHVSADGYPVCPVDAVRLPHADESAIKSANTAIRDLAERFQDYWLASRVQQPSDDTPKEVDEYDAEGNVIGTKTHPDWQRYYDAQDTLENAQQDVRDIAVLHQGEPDKTDDQGNVTAEWQAWSDARGRLASGYQTTF